MYVYIYIYAAGFRILWGFGLGVQGFRVFGTLTITLTITIIITITTTTTTITITITSTITTANVHTKNLKLWTLSQANS